MKTLATAALVALLGTGPVLAGIGIDLPRLTWPDETAAPAEPATRSCADPARPAGVEACASKG